MRIDPLDAANLPTTIAEGLRSFQNLSPAALQVRKRNVRRKQIGKCSTSTITDCVFREPSKG